MLRGKHNGGHRLRTSIHIAHGELALRVRTEEGQRAVLAENGLLLHQAVRVTLLTGGGLMLLCCAALLPAAKSLTLTAAFYAVACCMAQTVPSFVNALGMAAERKGMRLNFGISRGAGSIGFGLTAQLANVLLLRGGLRTVPLYSLCLAAILTATAFCFPRTAEDAPEAETERASGLGRFLRGSPRFCLLLAGAFLLFFGHNTLASYLYRVAQW